MRTEQSFAGLGPEDRCSSWGQNKVLLVLGWRTSVHHEDRTKFCWSWAGGPMLIMRTEQSFAGLGLEDRCSSWGQNKVLLVLGWRTSVHHEDRTKFCWSWAGGPVFTMRTVIQWFHVLSIVLWNHGKINFLKVRFAFLHNPFFSRMLAESETHVNLSLVWSQPCWSLHYFCININSNLKLFEKSLSIHLQILYYHDYSSSLWIIQLFYLLCIVL
jgi:hypothetical protein